jgi:hypothetical protein
MAKATKKSVKKPVQKAPEALRLDLGCGINKIDGFIGVDSLKLPGVDIVADLTKTWPWKNNSVDEIYMSHTLEHFTQEERVHVMNEMYRVLKPVTYDTAGKAITGVATIITPSVFSGRAYGDPTHKWPAISDWFYLYLNKTWRMGDGKDNQANAPHADYMYNKKGYNCDFERTLSSYNLHPLIQNRNQEFQQESVMWKIEAAQDIIAQLLKR